MTAQTVLGGARFLQEIQRVFKGNARGQKAARQLGSRPKLAEIIAAVEKVKAEPWEAFRDRYGDWG